MSEIDTSMFETPEDFNFKLIELVCEHQPIYNHFYHAHKSKHVIDNNWREIAQQLQSTGKFWFYCVSFVY